MKSKLKPYIDEIKEKRLSGIKVNDLAEMYGVSKDVMKQFLYRNNISLSIQINEKLNNPTTVEKIIGDYRDGQSLVEIGEKLGIGPNRIKKVLISNSVEIRDASHARRTYDIDEHYFDVIDTPNKAYILGLLYSDGNINTSGGHYTIRIRLQEYDVDILEKIRHELKYTGNLRFYDLNNKNSNWQNCYGLEINNKHMVEKLMEYGVIPNKSLLIKFPNFLKKELVSHFIRGFWDGDGHISTKRYLTCCTCNGDFILGLQEFLYENFDINSNVYTHDSPSGKVLNLVITSKEKTINFLNYIYQDAELYMDRKHDSYINKYCNNSQ